MDTNDSISKLHHVEILIEEMIAKNRKGLWGVVKRGFFERNKDTMDFLDQHRNKFDLQITQVLECNGITVDNIYSKLDQAWNWSFFEGKYEKEFDEQSLFFWSEGHRKFYTKTVEEKEEIAKKIRGQEIKNWPKEWDVWMWRYTSALGYLLIIVPLLDRYYFGKRWNLYLKKAEKILKNHAKEFLS